MANFKVVGTDHTAFTVSDIERTIKVFTDLLGYEVLSNEIVDDCDAIQTLTGVEDAAVKMAYLRAPGGHEVELLEYFETKDRKRMKGRPCDIGFAHIALNVDNVEAAVEEAQKLGFETYNKILNMDVDGRPLLSSVYMHDADGINIEFIARY